jgi:hypothetical protein
MDRTLTTSECRLAKLEAADDVCALGADYCRWADRGYSMTGADDRVFAALFTEDVVRIGRNGRPAEVRDAIAARTAASRPLGMHSSLTASARQESFMP